MELTWIKQGICAAKGFTAGGIHSGLRKNKDKKDLALILSEVMCNVACAYTQNKVTGAPILVTKTNVKDGKAQAIICNSGNANTCNANGIEIAVKMCKLAGSALNLQTQDIIVASTGVIGQPLDITPIKEHIGELASVLAQSGEASNATCDAIMTTDTVKKEFACEFILDGKCVKIGGIAKGSGMINPNMATMLAFITTDCNISSKMLQNAVDTVVKTTLNMVSVDGDTSTNDMYIVMANGMAQNTEIKNTETEQYKIFESALFTLSKELSRAIAKDGEGATKLLECNVKNAPNETTAQLIAKSVINSSLFKSAMFGEDANWGRILCAIGYTDAEFDINQIDVKLMSKAGEVAVCQNGAGLDFDEDVAKTVLSQDEIKINIDMKQGAGDATAWGCDLTYDYVKINGDYRS